MLARTFTPKPSPFKVLLGLEYLSRLLLEVLLKGEEMQLLMVQTLLLQVSMSWSFFACALMLWYLTLFRAMSNAVIAKFY